MKKFEARMSGVLPSEELPIFFGALESMSARPRKSIRIRRDLSPEAKARWTREKLISVGIPIGDPVSWYPDGHFFDLAGMSPHPSRHPLIAAGIGFIQEAGAMEVIPALEVAHDHLVLDLCAAPGAKSTHIGEYLGPEGWLVANEPDRMRSKLLDVILARHGIGNSTVYNLEPHVLARECEDLFDRILVDAPCSGESLFAKRTEKRKDVSDKEVGRCALRQNAILEQAWRMLVPGGLVVYSTCAYSRTENEELVASFVEAHPDARLVREQRRFPHRDGVPGGYFAVLRKEGSGGEDSRSNRRDRLEAAVRKLGTRGLVRDRRVRWNGNLDPYTVVMDRKSSAGAETLTDALGVPSVVPLDMSEASRLIQGGSSLSPAGTVIYTWESERIAGANGSTLHYPRGRLR